MFTFPLSFFNPPAYEIEITIETNGWFKANINGVSGSAFDWRQTATGTTTPFISLAASNVPIIDKDNIYEDISVTGATVTISNGPPNFETEGVASSSGSVDNAGSGTYKAFFDGSAYSGLTALSVESWTVIGGTTNLGYLLEFRDGGSTNNWLAVHRTNTERYQIIHRDSDGNFGTTPVNSAMDDGLFHHIVLVFDGSLIGADKIKLYIDGAASTTAQTLWSGTLGDFTTYHVGTGQANFPAEGSLDSQRVYTKALSVTEISRLQTDPNQSTMHYDDIVDNALLAVRGRGVSGSSQSVFDGISTIYQTRKGSTVVSGATTINFSSATTNIPTLVQALVGGVATAVSAITTTGFDVNTTGTVEWVALAPQ